MSTMLQAGELAPDNMHLLAYVQRMAQTAQPAAARRLFDLFAKQETGRIEANGALQLPASWHGIGVAQTAPAVSAEIPAWPRGKKVCFQVTAEPGSDVFVAGSFNNWNPTQYRLHDNPGSGHCKTTLVLPPGRHEYKFVVNGQWCADPDCTESTPNDQGSMNSVISI